MAKTLQHQIIEGALDILSRGKALDALLYGAEPRRRSVLRLGPCRRAFLRGGRVVARCQRINGNP